MLLSGPGIGLPSPQTLYPANLVPQGIAYQAATNLVTLAAGQTQIIPKGAWYVETDGYSVLQYNDPIYGTWRGFSSVKARPVIINSDGFNFRVANLTSCVIGAVITNQGSGYTNGTSAVTMTASVGNSTWQVIVGGAISTAVTVGTAGSGYTIPPFVYFPAPPAPGVRASGYATLTNGTVSAVTVTNQGAGYTAAPVPVFIPSPFDTNLANIVSAAATTTISGNSGKVCAVICTNPANTVASIPSLTFAGGGGTNAAATAVVMYTIASATGSGGTNYVSGNNLATTVGGVTSATNVLTNPDLEFTSYIPRPMVGVPTVAAGAVTGFTFTDTGLFMSSNLSSNLPTILVLAQTGGSAPSGALTLTPTLGATQSTVLLQPVGGV